MWDELIKQIQEQAKNKAAREKEYQAGLKGPNLTYNPIQESYVDAQGNPVNPLTPGAKKKIGLRSEFQMSGPQNLIDTLMQQQGVEEQGLRNKAMEAATQGQAQAYAQQAMRGGARSGARAQLGRQSMLDLMKAQQGVSQMGAEGRAGILSKGEELKRQTEAGNLETLLKSVGSVNQFNLDKYKTKMGALAAERTADATRQAAQNSSKK